MDRECLRKNLANAVRQSSLAKSSRMGELLGRFERGLPCGTSGDIDFLIDEIVNRIEERLFVRLTQLPDLASCQLVRNDEKVAKGGKLPSRPRPSICDSTLRHQARLLVDRVLRMVIRSHPGLTQGDFQRKQPAMTGAPTYTTYLVPPREGCGKVIPSTVKQYHQSFGKRVEPKVAKDDRLERSRVATYKTTPAQPQRGYLRFAYGDGESVRTETTYALRKAAKSSLRRYSITGNVKALMCAGEWARDDDVRVISVPANESTTSRLLDGFDLLLRSDDENYRQVPSNGIPERRQVVVTSSKKVSSDAREVSYKGVSEKRHIVLSRPMKKSAKTKRIGKFLNSSYTYARRSEIKKALPKFMASRSRNAMMAVFDAIRIAMADEDVENLDYNDLIAALIDQSSVKESSSKAPRSNSVPTRSPYGTEVKPVKRQQDAEPRYKTSADYSTKTSSYIAEVEIRDRPAIRQQNVSTTGSYKAGKAIRSCLGHMVQKGSSLDALLSMSRHMKEGQTDKEFWDNVISTGIDEKTRKEMISDLVEIGRQVRGVAEADSKKRLEEQQQQRCTVASEEEKTARTERLSTDCTRPDTGEQIIDRLGNAGLRYDTNYKYGINKGLKRFLPKFTGNRRYSALLHYADSLMADAYKELTRTVDLTSTVEDASQEPKQLAQEVTTHVEKNYAQSEPVDVDRRSESAKIGKVVAKSTDVEVFHDAYSWVAQQPNTQAFETQEDEMMYTPVETMNRVKYAEIIDDSTQVADNHDDSAGMEYKPVETKDYEKYDRYVDHRSAEYQSDLDETLYMPVETMDDVKYAEVANNSTLEDNAKYASLMYRPTPVTDDQSDLFGTEYTPIETRDEVMYGEVRNESAPVDLESDASKRSVRFSDGFVPGQTNNDEEDHASPFFKKLGYYERVGSGELLHKDSQNNKDQPDRQGGSENRQVDTKEENPQPSTQQCDKPVTLCNCL